MTDPMPRTAAATQPRPRGRAAPTRARTRPNTPRRRLTTLRAIHTCHPPSPNCCELLFDTEIIARGRQNQESPRSVTRTDDRMTPTKRSTAAHRRSDRRNTKRPQHNRPRCRTTTAQDDAVRDDAARDDLDTAGRSPGVGRIPDRRPGIVPTASPSARCRSASTAPCLPCRNRSSRSRADRIRRSTRPCRARTCRGSRDHRRRA